MFLFKPQCVASIRQGKRLAWRWHAYILGEQRVGGMTFPDGHQVGQCNPGGYKTLEEAWGAMKATMRGWNVMNVEYRSQPPPRPKAPDVD